MDSLDDGAKRGVQGWKARLDRWSSILRSKPAVFDEGVKKLPLLYVGNLCEVAGGSAHDGRGWACLMIGMRLRSQVLYMERHFPPKVGDVIQLTPDLVNMKDQIGCAWALSEVGGGSATQVFYKQLGLTCFKVTGLRDMAHAEAEFARERAEARKATQLKHVFESLDTKPRPGRKRKRVGPATGSKEAKQASKSNGGNDDGREDQAGDGLAGLSDSDDCDPLDVLDAELAGQELYADQDPHELIAEVPDEELEEMAAAHQPNADSDADAAESNSSIRSALLI